MTKRNQEEAKKIFLAGAVRYAHASKAPMTKVAWALATILKKPDNVVYHELRVVEEELASNGDLEDMTGRLSQDEVVEEELGDEEVLENQVGEIVTVKAVSVRSYGVVCVVEGTTRTLLLHISEVANEFIEDLTQYVAPGDRFEAMLVSNDKGRLGLSAKRFKPLKKKEIVVDNPEVEKKYEKFYEEDGEEIDFR